MASLRAFPLAIPEVLLPGIGHNPAVSMPQLPPRKRQNGKRRFSSTQIGMPTVEAPEPCSAKKSSSDAQPSAMHVVCSSMEQCYQVWPAVRSGIQECPSITGVRLIGDSYCCQLMQGVSNAEAQIANLFGADIKIAACTC